MRLAERMAMHAGAWQRGEAPAYTFGARAGAWERGARAAGTEVVAAAVGETGEVVGAPVLLRGHGGREERVEGEVGAGPVMGSEVGIDASQVRGPAWSHGVYRLFVRGRAVARTAPVVEDRSREVAVAIPMAIPVSTPSRVSASPAAARHASPAWQRGAAVGAEGLPPRSEDAALLPRAVVGGVGAVLPRIEEVARAVVGAVVPRCEEASRAVVGAVVPRSEEAAVVGVVVPRSEEVSRVVVGGSSGAAEVRTLHVNSSRAAEPDGWALGAAEGGLVRRVVCWPLAGGGRPGVLGGALGRLELPDGSAWRRLVPRLAGVGMPEAGGSPVVFLDVETTALDRGAGALAFMVGLAAFVGDALRVEQWVLTKLSAEPQMLAEVGARIVALAGPGAALASYNGASFDVPLLRTRLQRARLGRGAFERAHVDLLHPARRMWQGRERDCRLATLERTRLGVRRVHDLAGHEIPAVFWAWLRRPDDGDVRALMQRAADHNLADLVTLPALGAAIGRCLDAPADLEEAVRAAQHMIVCGRRGEAMNLLAAWQDRPGPPPLRRRALLLAAELLRRDAGSSGAPALWAEVCRISPGDPTAHEALAKHLEHRVGDLEQALAVASASAAPCPRRVARLQRKLAAHARA